MVIKSKDFIAKFEELKKKFGSTKEFRQFEKKYASDIEFIKFKQKNGLKHSKKNGWNKPFSPMITQVWIKDKKNWHKGLRKFGYYENVMIGWQMGRLKPPTCLWCGKILKGKQTKFCSIEPKNRHKKLFSKIINIGKKLHGFDLTKNYHILIKPKLYEYSLDKSGKYFEHRNEKERIEFKDIEFSINGKHYPLTRKSRTIIH